MKKNNYGSLIIVILTMSTFIYFNYFHKDNENTQYYGNLLGIVERNNNYVIQNSIISVAKLNEILDNTDVKVVAIESNETFGSYIPNTRIIKYKDIVTTENNISELIASKDQITNILSSIGINNDDTVILYDKTNSPYVTRLFWTLKVYGHECVKILNGGLESWVNKGFKIGNPILNPVNTIYTAHDKNEDIIANLVNIKESFANDNIIVLDVRAKEEYDNGHIPGAINIPYTKALNEDGQFKNFQELQEIYHPKGVTPDKEAIYVYCTKGNRASFTYFVLHELMGYNNVKVYDGSFHEYSLSNSPIEK